jgi:Zn finger protein HypA/HybF involved in hydrogenase expression
VINLEASSALILYLCCSIAAIFLIWANDHFLKKKKPSIAPAESLFLCEYCHFLYLASQEKPVTECPQCGSLNKKNSFKPM